MLGLRSRRDESSGVETVMRAHQERTQSTDGSEIVRRCWANDGAIHALSLTTLLIDLQFRDVEQLSP